MSDEQRKEEAEVEAHRRRHMANDEPSEDAETEDDFEAHRFRKDRPKKD
jgi:hypothetical protein